MFSVSRPGLAPFIPADSAPGNNASKVAPGSNVAAGVSNAESSIRGRDSNGEEEDSCSEDKMGFIMMECGLEGILSLKSTLFFFFFLFFWKLFV